MDDLFATIGGSKAATKGNNFVDGKGVVVIRELIAKKANEGRTFIAATTVVSSASKGDVDPVTKQTVVPNAVGSSPSWPQKIDKHKSAAGNVKAFTLNLLGFKEAEVSVTQFAEALARLVSKEQPARGMLVGYETFQQEIAGGPNKGKVMTLVRWIHVPPDQGNDKASIATRRAELDKTSPISN